MASASACSSASARFMASRRVAWMVGFCSSEVSDWLRFSGKVIALFVDL